MYLPKGVAILICSAVKTHVFARGGDNFELFWWKYGHVVQRGWQISVVS